MCKTKEFRDFAEYPFTFALSKELAEKRNGPRVERLAVPCTSCGSVIILGNTRAANYRRKGVVFCDIQCAGDYKRWQYTKKEHHEKAGYLAIQERNQKEQNEVDKTKWTCCDWCWKAFRKKMHTSRHCSDECSWQSNLMQLRLTREKKPGVVCCMYCNKEKALNKGFRKGLKYCSETCHRKAAKQRREFWARANGPSQYIDLGKLVMRDKKKCSDCGVVVTRYNGDWRPTDASIDHVVPLSKGGWHTWSNVKLMCHACNSAKCDELRDGMQMMMNMSG